MGTSLQRAHHGNLETVRFCHPVGGIDTPMMCDGDALSFNMAWSRD